MSLPDEPLTRKEQYLSNIAGQGGDLPEEPLTRVEQYLDYIARNGGTGGGSVDITIDSAPTQGSTNAVSSGGVYAALVGKQDALTFDTVPTEGSDNPVTSDGLYVALDKVKSHIYAFHIDGSESDPSAKVTYLEDAKNMVPAHMDYATGKFDYGSWKNVFFMPRPCMVLQEGIVDYYLDPDDYTKKEDGTASDIADTSYAGNAMMEWGQNRKKIWYKVVPDANDVTSGTVYIADDQMDSGYHAWSFINNQGELVDHFYTAIYNGSSVNDGSDDVMRSMSGLAITQSLSGTVERDMCLANNKGSEVLWYTEVIADRILINFLLILMGKSTDTQTVFGRGLDSGSQTALDAYRTGALNDKGLFFGYNDGNHGVKVFGMENWWGAQWRRTAGYIKNGSDQLIKLTYGQQDGSTVDGYNTDGLGYINMGITPTGTSGGYIDVMNFNEYGMFGKNSSGSSSTHFCDGQWFNNSATTYAIFGGYSTSGLLCGAFCYHLSSAVSNVSWYYGVALSYRPRE